MARAEGRIERGEGTTGGSLRRSLIKWEIPHVGSTASGPRFIEMYVNPESIRFSSSKITNRVFTKGGYILQYWGEGLDEVVISGTTGSSGIEGINVLRDIYRSEQLTLIEIVKNLAVDKRRQSLAQLAASVIMWYQGQGLRGYFTSMDYTETKDQLGLFNYTLNYSVTQVIGKRNNFMPWHRKPWSTTDTAKGSATTGRGDVLPREKVGELNTPVRDAVGTRFEAENDRIQQQTIRRPDPKARIVSAINLVANQSPPNQDSPPPTNQ